MSRRFLIGGALIASLVFAAAAIAAVAFHVRPGVFDPAKTRLVQSAWLNGIGCPTNATLSDGTSYTDPGCPTGDPNDQGNQGLLLAKTGPTPNNAAAFAVLGGAKGTAVTELGYDIRKPGPDGAADPGGGAAGPRGSHCGAGAPRFNITLTDGTLFFIGCNSPSPTTQTAGVGWLRLRWGGSAPLLAYSTAGVLTDITGKTVKDISIVFDEGQDTGPDNFGLAVIDNIDVNGTLVGHGPNTHDSGGDNGDNGDNDNGDD